MDIDYLLGGEPWLQYAVKLDMLHENKKDLIKLRNRAIEDNKIQVYLQDVAAFHDNLVTNHKNPELSIHKLLFLLEIGFDMEVAQINTAIQEILKHKDKKGIYQSRICIPKHFGGSGEPAFGWCLCDAPLLMLALVKANIPFDEHIRQGVDNLLLLYKNWAFPCVGSEEIGKFRGPGRKEDCCPYATLIMLKLMANIEQYKDSNLARDCIDSLLGLWETSREQHPYMFYMGTDFRKLKAPAIWYDVVSVADCLSQFNVAKKDARFINMVSIIESKQDQNGRFTPESIYLKCKEWDFGQKKMPSPYLTYCCTKILQRMA